MSSDPRDFYAGAKLKAKIDAAKMHKAQAVHEIATFIVGVGAAIWIGATGGSVLDSVLAYAAIAGVSALSSIAQSLRARS